MKFVPGLLPISATMVAWLASKFCKPQKWSKKRAKCSSQSLITDHQQPTWRDVCRPRSISFHTTPSKAWNGRAPRARQEKFQSILRKHGLVATLRREKGHDIAAACGQLRLQTKRSERRSGFSLIHRSQCSHRPVAG